MEELKGGVIKDMYRSQRLSQRAKPVVTYRPRQPQLARLFQVRGIFTLSDQDAPRALKSLEMSSRPRVRYRSNFLRTLVSDDHKCNSVAMVEITSTVPGLCSCARDRDRAPFEPSRSSVIGYRGTSNVPFRGGKLKYGWLLD